MGVGKHGMSHAESRSIQDALEWSPSKNQASSHIATSGMVHHGAPTTKARAKSATSGKPTPTFRGSGGGGGGHNRKGKKY